MCPCVRRAGKEDMANEVVDLERSKLTVDTPTCETGSPRNFYLDHLVGPLHRVI